MPKFILIDNSISDTNGHYYQYAVHCMRAAKDLGFECILATNKNFAKYSDLGWKVIPVYTNTFWASGGERSSTIRIYHYLLSRVYQIKYKTVFSEIGLLWENRKNLDAFLRSRVPGDDALHNPILALIAASIMVPPFLACVRILEKMKKIQKRYQHSLLKTLLTTEPNDPITGGPFNKEKSDAFARETFKLFRKTKLENGDIVFVPTVGAAELLGILEYLKRDERSHNASWHLLFRRNIYLGRESDYWRQDEDLRPLRNMLSHFMQESDVNNVVFYTDTPELTDQHDRLDVTKFHTLPIPHTIESRSDANLDKPLTISYIGDARTEKGYYYLPDIVGDLWQSYVETGKVKFVFQSNYNIPHGEPKIVVARSQLEGYPDDKVKLLLNPLSLEEYHELLYSSQIVLLPYSSGNYYARSSGILAECLAAGIPVVVPSGSWLSRQFAIEIYRYHAALRKDNATLVHSVRNIDWQRHGSSSSAFVDNEMRFGGESTKAYCRIRRMQGAPYLMISLRIEGRPRTCVEIHVVHTRYDFSATKSYSQIVEKFEDCDYSSFLVRLEDDSPLLWIGLKNAFGEDTISVSDTKIDFISSDNLPLSAVGIIYHNPSDISYLLRDLIDNYSHYRRTAIDFSKEYFARNNSKELVREIIAQSKSKLEQMDDEHHG